MFREEWRLHSHLFGGTRFGLFPLVVACLTAGASALLAVTGTAPRTVFGGLHALAFVFGLHTGSIGFVGRDSLRDLLGDVTLLVFSARTLPLSRRRLLAVFVAKDLLFYALLFLLPIAVGTASAVHATVAATSGIDAPVGAVASGIDAPVGAVASAVGVVLPALGTGLRLWLALTVSFVLGMGATLAGLGLSGRGVPGLAALAAPAAALAVAWRAGVDVVAYTPYGAFLDPTPSRVAASLAAVAVVSVVAAAAFDPSVRRPARTVDPAFRRLDARLGDPVAAKTVLDLRRSAGGVWKVLFSAAILFGVTVALVDLAGRITGVDPSVGVSFGTILGLTGFTTFNWLTQADDIDAYLVHPLSVGDVFAAKFRAFLLFGPLVGLAFYALAVGWLGGSPAEVAVGAALLVGVTCYIFGTTVYLAGLSPNEFLFDATLFAAFGFAMIVPLVPPLVVGFALAPVSGPLLAALGAGAVALALAGVALYRRSIPKWSAYRRRTSFD